MTTLDAVTAVAEAGEVDEVGEMGTVALNTTLCLRFNRSCPVLPYR